MWQPSSSLENLQARAKIISQIRNFFAERNVLEVETPLLSHATVSDPYVHGIPANHQNETLYLQTSPEYAMKRLLAAGSGSIFQMCKAFRYGDVGQIHNPEFTMLEWYRVDFDHHDLMNEMDALLQLVLQTAVAERMTCADVYEKFVGINPHLADIEELAKITKEKINIELETADRNTWLELLFSHCIEPHIGQTQPFFLYDFPVSQAALAKIRPENPPVASRFEVYFKGIELANGFHELQNASEQRKRFENDLAYRRQYHFSVSPLDENFLAALEHGMPDCAGVALGVDRLIMLALGYDNVADVLSFAFDRA